MASGKIRGVGPETGTDKPLARFALFGIAQSVFENSVLGGTGHWPVPSGDSPDGRGATVRGDGHGLFEALLAEVPVGGPPTGAGGTQRVARATHFQNRLSDFVVRS